MSKKRRQQQVVMTQTAPPQPEPEVKIKRLQPKTANQRTYFRAVEHSTITIVTGPAGTGKTYMAAGMAANALRDNEVDKIVLVRPLVVCGSTNIGALPGELGEKIGPYMQPLLEAFQDFFRPQELQALIRTGKVELKPLEFLRGATLKKTFVILDEAQNCEYVQLRMFLTRLGEGSKYVITGDVTQNDRKAHGPNPLGEVVKRFSDRCHRTIAVVKLSREDQQRHPLINWIEERLNDEEQYDGVDQAESTDGESEAESEWLGEDCPLCDAEMWYPETDDKNHPTEQVICWRCNCTIEMPDDEDLPPWQAEVCLKYAVKSLKKPPENE